MLRYTHIACLVYFLLGISPASNCSWPTFRNPVWVYTQPLKMELIQGSETSANYNLTPGKYPEENIQYSNHGESLKSRIACLVNLDYNFLPRRIKRRRRRGITFFCIYEFTGFISHRNNKITLYKTVIKPIKYYGSVTWTLTQKTEQMLCTFERKILRGI